MGSPGRPEVARQAHLFFAAIPAGDPGAWWIHATREAARWASTKGWAAIAGGGLMHLDFTRWAANSFGPTAWVDIGKHITAKPTGAGPAPEKWCDLRLKPKLTKRIGKRELFKVRDDAVASLSDNLIAVAVRENGHMEETGRRAIDEGKTVYVLDPPENTRAYRGNINLLELGASILEIEIKIPDSEYFVGATRRVAPTKGGVNSKTSADLKISPDDYLWHFTRECPGPWPGGTWDNYFKELVSGTPGAGHTALDSLARILIEGRIRASGRMIRGGCPAVCWTGSSPAGLLERRRYRSALVRWEFQPYAIGVRREVAKKLGLKPVIYKPENEYNDIPPEDRFRFQVKPDNTDNIGTKWAEEEEWRNEGDFHLSDLHPTEGAVLVNSKAEIPLVAPLSRFLIIGIRL